MCICIPNATTGGGGCNSLASVRGSWRRWMDMLVDAEAMSGGDGRWAEAIKESEATGGTDCQYRGNE